MRTQGHAVDGDLEGIINALKAEGIDKGKEDAHLVVESAKREAAGILNNAKTEADAIIAKARKTAQESHDRLETQLDLALRDFILKAKGELEELIALKPMRDAVKSSMSDPKFIKSLIEKMVDVYLEFVKDRDKRHIDITVPDDMKADFEKQWLGMVSDKLNSVVDVNFEKNLFGFKISFDKNGGAHVVDANSIVNALRPFIAERFHYILDKNRK